jgi:hypothetical protein
MSTTDGTTDTADRIRLSYRPVDAGSGDEDGVSVESLREETFLTYLRRAHDGPVAAGDEWDEFVNCGCGTTEDVLLRVEGVEDGSTIGESTEIVIVDD